MEHFRPARLAADDELDSLYGGKSSKASRRAVAKGQSASSAAAEIATLEARIAHLRTAYGCEFCAGLPRGAEKLKYDCGDKFGLVIKDDVVTCPTCKTCLACWEG